MANQIFKGGPQQVLGALGQGGLFNSKSNEFQSKDWVQTTLKITDKNRDMLRAAFDKWLEDESYFPDYDRFEIIRPGFAIIRLFRYTENLMIPVLGKKKDGVDQEMVNSVDALGRPNTSSIMLPYAKVIKVGPQANNATTLWKAGDIGILSDLILKAQVNPKWLAWNKKTKERSSANGVDGIPFEAMHELEPKKEVNGLEGWEGTELVLDKFDPQPFDEVTFLRPASEMNYKDIIYSKDAI